MEYDDKPTMEYCIKELRAASGELFTQIAKAFRIDRLMELTVKIADKHYEKKCVITNSKLSKCDKNKD